MKLLTNGILGPIGSEGTFYIYGGQDMNERFVIHRDSEVKVKHLFGAGVQLGAGLIVGTVIGFGMVGAAGYLLYKLSPNVKPAKKEEEVIEDGGSDSKSAD